jgi:hypothetical protein
MGFIGFQMFFIGFEIEVLADRAALKHEGPRSKSSLTAPL